MGVLGKLKRAASDFEQGLKALPETTYAGAKNAPNVVRGAAHGNRNDILALGGVALAIGGAAAGARAATMPGEAGEASLASRVLRGAPSPQARANTIAARSVRPVGTAPVPVNISTAARAQRLMEAPKGLSMRGRQLLAGGEQGSMKLPYGFQKRSGSWPNFPSEGSAKVKAAHANVPPNQMLFTSEKNAQGEVINALSGSTLRKATGPMNVEPTPEQKINLGLAERANNDVESGRARLAGFYEKLKSEEGVLKFPSKPGSMVGRVKNKVMAGINEATGATGRAEEAKTKGKITAIREELGRMNKNEGGFMRLPGKGKGEGEQPGGQAYETVRRANLKATRSALRDQIGLFKEVISHDTDAVLEATSRAQTTHPGPGSKMTQKLIQREQKQRRVLKKIGVDAGAQYQDPNFPPGSGKTRTEGAMNYHSALSSSHYAERNYGLPGGPSHGKSGGAIAKALNAMPRHKAHASRMTRN